MSLPDLARPSPCGTAAHPYEGVPFVVLAGLGRSGTTALRSALTLHPDLDSTGCENNIIDDTVWMMRRNLIRPDRRDNLRVPQRQLAQLAKQFLLHALWPRPRPDRPRALLACSDVLLHHMRLIHEHWPESRILYVVRNGIEVVASRQRFAGFDELPFERHCDDWASVGAVIHWGGSVDRFHLVRHEHLLDPAEAARAMTRVFQFLGLREAHACAASLQSKIFHPTSPTSPSTTPKAILADRSRRWWSWTEQQRACFMRTCSESMAALGYGIPQENTATQAVA